MLTWRIHRTLNDPLKREPIIWRGYQRLLFAARTSPRRRLIHMPGLARFIVLMFVAPVFSMGVIIVFFPAPLLAALLNTLYGLQTVTGVSGRIAAEYERRTYDLLCALPYGKIGAHWLFGVNWFQASKRTRFVLGNFVLLGLVAAPFLFGGWAYPITGQRAVEFWFVDTLSFGVFLVYDYLNTRVIGAVIGMLVPALTRNPRTIRALSIGMFLLIQVASYVLGAAIALVLLPDMLVQLRAQPSVFLVIAPITVVVVILFREWLTRRLWRQISSTMQTTPMELDLLLR